ncbi:unnamed protein product [Laminaria digitata]
MTAQRGTTTLAVLGLLAGFVDVDSFRMAPVPVVVSSSVPARAQASAVCRRKGSSAWRTAHRGLSMSSLSALDDLATEELGKKASRASVMDELDAILGDVQTAASATPPTTSSGSSGSRSPMDALDQGHLDSLLASAATPGAATAAPTNGDLDDLDLDDLLGPASQPPQRYSGGGTSAGRDAGGWNEPASSAGYNEQQSYGGGGGEDFGAARGAFGNNPDAAHQKAVKGDRLVTNVEVSDESACPVAEKDVDAKTVAALAARGIENFTPVQAITYDHILSGRDIIGKSRTGTGKTIAFGLPVIQHLARFADDHETRTYQRGRSPRFLVVCPTRELARQVYEELATLGRGFGLRAEVFHGGAAYGPQEGALRSGLDILVATPGRVIDHLQRGNLNLGQVQHAVLDEADEMLNMGFADDIESIFSYINVRECQVLLFSATVPSWVRNIANKYTDNPLTVDAVGKTDNKLATTVTHVAIEVHARHRATMLEDIITFYGKGSHAIVFTQTKRECDELAAGQTFNTLTSQVC